MLGKQQVFGVFYRDYAHEVVISSAKPESLLAERIPALAGRLLVNEDNYLGIVDRNEVILQLYLDDDDQVVMELLRPDAPGCLRSTVTLAEALERLSKLPDCFEPSLLHDAELINDEGA